MRVAGFRFLLGLAAAGGTVAVGFGGWAIVADLRERGDTWDGLGVLIGALLAGAGLAAVVAAVVAIRVARSRPTAARVLGVLLALAGLGVAYPIVVDTEMDWWLAMLPGALMLLALLPDDRPVQ
ncbi:MAG TPA: hypothetical protein VFV40_10385 [Nocardioides sp.]|nr:hypothetical protein [Nocardioides sp.]